MASTLATSVINYLVYLENARRLSTGWNLNDIESAVEKKLKKCHQFPWETTSGLAVLQISYNNKVSWLWIQNRTVSQITVYTSTRISVRSFRVTMVAAIDWCSQTTHAWIWLVSCFGSNGPLRQCFSLYRAISHRERKKRQTREKLSKQSSAAPTASAIGLCPSIIQSSRMPHHWKFTQRHRTTRPPPHDWTSATLSLCENNKQSGFTLVSGRFSKTTQWHKLEKQI